MKHITPSNLHEARQVVGEMVTTDRCASGVAGELSKRGWHRADETKDGKVVFRCDIPPGMLPISG
jgi:hypothetical protein